MPNKARRIPIMAAKRIANDYGYDQVIVVARHTDGVGHLTTYGKTRELCADCKVTGELVAEFLGMKFDKIPSDGDQRAQ